MVFVIRPRLGSLTRPERSRKMQKKNNKAGKAAKKSKTRRVLPSVRKLSSDRPLGT